MRIGSGGNYNILNYQQALTTKKKETENNELNAVKDQSKLNVAVDDISMHNDSETQTATAAISNEESIETAKDTANTAISFDISKNTVGMYDKMLEDLRTQRSELDEKTKNDVAAAKKQILGGLLGRVEMMQGSMYSSKSWANLMKTYGISKAVSLDDDADIVDLEKAIKDIVGAINALRKAETEDTKQREMLPLVMKMGGTASEQAAITAAVKSVTKATGIKISL